MEVRGENDCGQPDAGRISCALTALPGKFLVNRISSVKMQPQFLVLDVVLRPAYMAFKK